MIITGFKRIKDFNQTDDKPAKIPKAEPRTTLAQLIGVFGKRSIGVGSPPADNYVSLESIGSDRQIIYLERCRIEQLGLSKLRLDSVEGYDKLVAAVKNISAIKRDHEAMTFLQRIGFSKAEILRAAVGPDLIFPCDYLSKRGYSQQVIEEAIRLDLVTILCRLVFGDYVANFEAEIDSLSLGMRKNFIHRQILNEKFEKWVFSLGLDSPFHLQITEKIDQETKKKYLRTQMEPALVKQHAAQGSLDQAVEACLYEEQWAYHEETAELIQFGFSQEAVRALFLQGNFLKFYIRFQLHQLDARYLVKRGIAHEDLMLIFNGNSVSYPGLAQLFDTELGILRNSFATGTLLEKGQISEKLKEWLNRQTCYRAVVNYSQRDPADQTNWLYLRNNSKFVFTKALLKKMFLQAADHLSRSNEPKSLFVSDGNKYEISYLAYHGNCSKIEVMVWSGRRDSALSEENGRLGRGGFSIVQRILRLATGQMLAMKAPMSDLPEDRQSIAPRQVLKEADQLRRLHGGNRVPGLMEAPFLIIDDSEADLTAHVTRQYDGDLTALARSNSPFSLADLLTGFTPAIKALIVLSEKKLMHGDLKPANMLFTLSENQLTFFLADLGGLRTYNEVRKGGHLPSTPGYCLDQDALEIRKSITNTALFEARCQKREVYGLATTIWLVLSKKKYAPGNKAEEVQEFGNLAGLLKQMLDSDIDKRPTFAQVLAKIEAEIHLLRGTETQPHSDDLSSDLSSDLSFDVLSSSSDQI